jgi:elongation factor G
VPHRLPIARPSPKQVEVDYTHKKQSGGSGQFARVKIDLPRHWKKVGLNFANSVVGGSVPKEYVPGVEKGIMQAKDTGSNCRLPGYRFPRLSLIDGASHDVDSSVLAFEIAARAAFREAMQKASPKLAGAGDEGRGADP